MNNYSKLQYFFWLVGGAEIHVLKNCKNDYNRHAGIGLVLLMTTIFASISGFSAGHFFSHGSLAVSIGFALLWAMLIYSIDRSMVVSLKKQDATESMSIIEKAKQYLVPFLARAVVGIMIGFFMSIPIEIIVFHDNIVVQTNEENQQKILEEINFVNASTGKRDKEIAMTAAEKTKADVDSALASDCPLPDYKSNVRLYREAIKVRDNLFEKYKQARDRANKIPQYILNADNESVYNAAFGRAIRARDNAFNDYNAQNRKANGYAAIYTKIDNDWRESKNTERKEADSVAKANSDAIGSIAIKADTAASKKEQLLKELNGFTRQYEALTHAAGKPGNGSLFFLLWLIRLIFIGIEILPMVTKLMTPVGDYDRALKNGEDMFKNELATDLENKTETEKLRLDSEKEIAKETESHRKTREIALNKDLIDSVARVQTEIATTYLIEWEKREKERSGRRIDEFIDGKS